MIKTHEINLANSAVQRVAIMAAAATATQHKTPQRVSIWNSVDVADAHWAHSMSKLAIAWIVPGKRGRRGLIGHTRPSPTNTARRPPVKQQQQQQQQYSCSDRLPKLLWHEFLAALWCAGSRSAQTRFSLLAARALLSENAPSHGTLFWEGATRRSERVESFDSF